MTHMPHLKAVSTNKDFNGMHKKYICHLSPASCLCHKVKDKT